MESQDGTTATWEWERGKLVVTQPVLGVVVFTYEGHMNADVVPFIERTFDQVLAQGVRPDMFVDVELPAAYAPTLTVPSDAVVSSGLRQMVFVDLGDGYFDPRPVTTGWRMEGRTEITRGLKEGERVVVAGTFLLDSEARLRYAAAGITSAPHRDVICEMDVDEQKALAAGRTSVFKGTTYYFCSDECKRTFDKDPARYARK